MLQGVKQQLSVILKYMLCLHCCVAFTCVAYSQITNPTELPGLSAWWCADSVKQDDGSAVSFWNNMANTTESVTQPVPDYSPTLVKNVTELNNHAVLRFDGNDYLDGGDILDLKSSGWSWFVVAINENNNGYIFAKCVSGPTPGRYSLTTNSLIYQGRNNTAYDVKYTYMANTPQIISWTNNREKEKNSVYINGHLTSESMMVGGFYMNTDISFCIGYGSFAAKEYFYKGKIAEIIAVSSFLSNIERQTVENYLRNKYFPGSEREQFSLGGTIKQEYSLKPVTLTVPDRAYFQTITWSTGENTQSISVTKSGLYAVHVTDDWGYDYIDTVNVVFPSFSYIPNQTICDGQSVVWDCGLSGDYTYEWSSGETTQSITITQAGKYAVKVTDNQGYSIVSDTVTIEMDDFSTMAKLGADTTLCKGNRIGLVSRASDATEYLWNTGATTSVITIENAGTYSVTAKNERGCTASDEVVVTIKGTAPIAAYVTQYVCEGDGTELLSNSTTSNNTAITNTQWIVEQDTVDDVAQTHRFSS